MEFINRVFLRGIVGTIRVNQIQDKKFASMSVVTEYAYKDQYNTPTIDTTWHNVKAIEGDNIIFDEITKGSIVEIEGRIRTLKYIDNTGADRTTYEIFANNVKLLGKSSQVK